VSKQFYPNIHDDLLSKNGLSYYYEKAKKKFQELDCLKELSPHLQKEYATLSSSILFGDYVINSVEDAKKIIKT
jgi:hypothetical protein